MKKGQPLVSTENAQLRNDKLSLALACDLGIRVLNISSSSSFTTIPEYDDQDQDMAVN